MPVYTFAYKVGREAALLNDEEWEKIEPLMDVRKRVESIARYQEETGVSSDEASLKDPSGMEALQVYFELTGVELEHPNQLYGVKLSEYGSLCPSCSKPFRTPRAKFCANCGYKLPNGEVAGPLGDQS
ncbi:hypothetical protein [Roseovarius phycicola]|uniref:Zinc ribbon domain-containing protein n=1 Tax=Roseovarius phycicola TaxID=3080976 RepID=A0ABZ2HHZ2_9RHOB